MAFVRGRFCELGAALCPLDPTEQYLLGMLSLLSAMLRIPMDRLASELPFRSEIREAILGAAVKERCLLAWIESHERNKIAESQTLAFTFGLDQRQLTKIYADALIWERDASDLCA